MTQPVHLICFDILKYNLCSVFKLCITRQDFRVSWATRQVDLLLQPHLLPCLFWHGGNTCFLRSLSTFQYLDKIKTHWKSLLTLKKPWLVGKSNREPAILFRHFIYQINLKLMNLIDVFITLCLFHFISLCVSFSISRACCIWEKS